MLRFALQPPTRLLARLSKKKMPLKKRCRKSVSLVARKHELRLPGCTRSTQTVWKEGKFTVVAAAGIKQHKEWVANMLSKELPKAKPESGVACKLLS